MFHHTIIGLHNNPRRDGAIQDCRIKKQKLPPFVNPCWARAQRLSLVISIHSSPSLYLIHTKNRPPLLIFGMDFMPSEETIGDVSPRAIRIIIIGITFLVLAAIAVGLRLWARRIRNTSLSFNDYAIMAALV